MAQNTKNMSSGSPMKLILGFALPLLFGMLFQQVYSLIDTIIVSKFLGVSALAGVGATSSINFLIIGFCNGMCSGFALPVAQRFGARDDNGLRKFVGNSAVLAIILGVFMTAVTSLLCRDILIWMRTPSDIIDLSYEYILVIFLGIPAIMLYNILSGYIRSLGNSITPLVFLIIAAFFNIGLDLLFILVFHLGIFGAALATVISQGISGLLCLFYIIFRMDILHLKKSDWILDSAYVKPLISMGIPMGFQYSITAIGSVILQTSVNALGSAAVASITAGDKISLFLMCPFDALGSTMATYGGQNVGAGRLDRLGKGLKSAVILGTAYSILVFIVINIFSKNILQIFVSAKETTVISQASAYLFWITLFYILLALVNIIRFLIQGMGFSGFAVFAGIAEMIGRGLIGLVFVPMFGFTAACLASPLAWIFADAFLIPAYFHCKHRLQQQFTAYQEGPGTNTDTPNQLH